MHLDVIEIRDFYTGRLGQKVRQHIAMQIDAHWRQERGQSIAGVGYTSPYLEPYLADNFDVFSLSPAGQGGVIWPTDGPLRSVLIDEYAFPVEAQSFDYILEIHGLEFFSDAKVHLREIWRVLRPEGRLLLIVPNRSGLWARVDTTPFGQGQPFSRGQLRRLLVEACFRPLKIEPLVHFAPFEHMLGFTGSATFEKVGAKVWPRFSGMLMVEAVKELMQPIHPRGVRVGERKIAPRPVRLVGV